MEIAVVESVTKTVGSLALVYPDLRRLAVAETIDRLTTKGKEREVPTGQVIEVLVLTRLAVRPVPISTVATWAQTQVVEEVYGFAAAALNDDRIGRALDDLHPHLTDAWAAIVLAGAQAYGVRLDRLHSDVTRVAFEGAYDQLPPVAEGQSAGPKITYGYTGKEDSSRKQVTVGLSVAADGGLPAWYRVADGNAADAQSYLPQLTAVREYLHLEQPLVIGDSKLITRPNVLGFCRVGARFIGPTGLTQADRAQLVAQWTAGQPMSQLDTAAVAAGEAPRAVPARYWGLECAEVLADPERDTRSALRRLFVQSLDDRHAARHQRAKDLARARRALWTIKGRLRHPMYRQRSFLERKVAQAVAKVRDYLHAEIVETPAGLDVRWRLDRARLREAAQFDGIYALVSNCPASEASTPAVFGAYKGQSQVEGRFRVVKHPPIQIRPLWLHQPRRIESLLFVVMVALFLFALIEREARRVVECSGQVFTGLRPEGRDQLPVTARQLFEAFAPLALVRQRLMIATEVIEVRTPTTLTPIQAQILERLRLMKPETYLQPAITPHPS